MPRDREVERTKSARWQLQTVLFRGSQVLGATDALISWLRGSLKRSLVPFWIFMWCLKVVVPVPRLVLIPVPQQLPVVAVSACVMLLDGGTWWVRWVREVEVDSVQRLVGVSLSMRMTLVVPVGGF
jgi:hypothetical protein